MALRGINRIRYKQEYLTEVLEESGLLQSRLRMGLEITENVMFEMQETTAKMFERIKHRGISISVDDFGTGYSSLTRLTYLPVDTIKIDRTFLEKVPANKKDADLTRAIVAMAHALNITVVAEGIETQEQLDFLRQTGCDLGQGYYFSKPLKVVDFEAYLGDSPRP